LGWLQGRSPHFVKSLLRRLRSRFLLLALGLVCLLAALGLHLAQERLPLWTGNFPQASVMLKSSRAVREKAGGDGATERRSPPSSSERTEDRDEGRAPRPLPQYGHLAFAEANAADLMIVASYSQDVAQRFERLHTDAGLALLKMIDAARLDGVWIVPVSGFRDYERQKRLFRWKTHQYGSAEAAAQVVAPPGHSEHHTGYAVDLSDGLARAMDVSLSFGKTAAFQWLTRRAAEFGFELSFPENNPQGVNYEPWHWRYVGTPAARRLFDSETESMKSVG
jgi:D-alanyl-D-alanine carboxypeptidase